ncbi:hypothetical protein CFP56_009135 [Quercus suber]|uniref:F-box domain-containing protein n=1 Tax=Quercus suber TaxID=58331 RepID=A0AAW0L3Z1_QUESU
MQLLEDNDDYEIIDGGDPDYISELPDECMACIFQSLSSESTIVACYWGSYASPKRCTMARAWRTPPILGQSTTKFGCLVTSLDNIRAGSCFT